jgi:hypothetical protein
MSLHGHENSDVARFCRGEEADKSFVLSRWSNLYFPAPLRCLGERWVERVIVFRQDWGDNREARVSSRFGPGCSSGEMAA